MSETPADSQDTLSRSEIRDASLRGVRWIVLGRIISQVAALSSTVLIARLVSPTQFGYAAAATFVFALAQALPQGSFGSPLVQAKELRPSMVRTSFSLSLITGVVMTAVIVLASLAFGGVFPHEASVLLLVVAPTFFLYSAGAVSQALLERSLDFRRSALNEVVALLPGTVATVIFAAFGLGGASIVLGYLVTSIVSSGQAIYWRPPGRPGWNREEARHIFRYGLPTSGSSILYVAQRNVQLVVLGARTPAAEVAFFWRAQQLGIEYQGRVSGILLRILFPVLSRAKNIEDMRAVRERMTKVHCGLLFPFLAALAVLAPLFVPWLFGDRWAPVAPATQILTIAGAVAVVGTGTGPLMMAVGKPQVLFRYALGALIIFAITAYVAAPYGLTAICWSIVGFRLLNLFGTQYFMVQRHTGIPVVQTLVRDVLPALGGCVALAAVCWPISEGLQALDLPTVIVMAVAAAAGIAAYAITLRVVFPQLYRDVSTLVARVLPGRPRRRTKPVSTPEAPR